MKKYIAFLNGHNSNSGIKTKEEAEQWAAKTLADKPMMDHVTLTEIVGEYHRTTPALRFEPALVVAQAAE